MSSPSRCTNCRYQPTIHACMKTTYIIQGRGFVSILPLHVEVTLLALCDDLLHEIWDWKPLGLKLGIPISYLKEIEHDYHRLQDRKQETLSRWLQIDEYPSWSTLVGALVRIHQRYLARTIAEKYGKIFINYTGSVVQHNISCCRRTYSRS